MNALDLLGGLVLDDGRTWAEAAEPFQVADAEAVLSGSPPYNFLTRSRGGSKTTDLAGVAVALLLTLPDRSRLVWTAADQEQGTLALDAIAGFLARTPSLSGSLDVKARAVTATATGSTLEVLPADAPSAWGLKPACVFVDELSGWSDTPGPRRLWEAVSSAVAKLPDARLVVLTTAGDPSHFSARVRDHALSDPLWRVHEVRGPAPWLDSGRVAEQRRRLTESMYRRLFENEWTEAEDRLATVGDVRACAVLDGPLAWEEGRAYAIGLDLGIKRDRTAAVIVHAEPFAESETGARVVVNRRELWKGSRIRPVKLGEVEEWIEQAAREYRAEVVFDPWQAVGMAQRLTTKGIRLVEHPFTTASTGRLASTLFQLLRDQALALPDVPEFVDEIAAAKLVERTPGHMRIDHDRSAHDDQVIALALASQHVLAQWAGDQGEWDIPFPPAWEGPWIFDRERERWRKPTEDEGGIKREVVFRATATTTATVIEENLDGLEER